jgi:uncharacterized damage-inducible protein DinB
MIDLGKRRSVRWVVPGRLAHPDSGRAEVRIGSLDEPPGDVEDSNQRGASVNGALLEAFRHNSWATSQLLVFCRDLPEEQLAASATGAYGSIRSTFNHLVLSDGRYLRRLAGDAPAWVDRPDDADLDELAAQAEEAGQLWERLLSEPVDAEGVVVVDDGALEVRAGVIVAQALHHGNAHREQICAILTNLGIEPPDIQPWEYAWATGRIWERTAAR